METNSTPFTVKVEKKVAAGGGRAKIQIEADGAYVEENEYGEKKKLEKAGCWLNFIIYI